MKNFAVVLGRLIFVLVPVLFPSCVSKISAPDNAAVFKDAEGKEWILAEVKSAGKTVQMDRKKLQADGLGGVYTITFNEGQVNGMGAPNRYFGPYTAGSNNSLVIGNLASTMMMAFKEPDGLNESGYFGFLAKVTLWALREGKLELYSETSDGTEAILVFIPE